MKQCLKKNEDEVKEMKYHPKYLLEMIKANNKQMWYVRRQWMRQCLSQRRKLKVWERKKVHAGGTYVWPKTNNAY
jgi:hypothetical protein